MSDENLQPIFQIQRVYLKDLSLEQPNSPGIFLEQEAPSIEVALDVGAGRVLQPHRQAEVPAGHELEPRLVREHGVGRTGAGHTRNDVMKTSWSRSVGN